MAALSPAAFFANGYGKTKQGAFDRRPFKIRNDGTEPRRFCQFYARRWR
jgi:hypothetical protein